MTDKPINRFNPYEVRQFKEELEATPAGNALNKYQRISSRSAIYPGQGTPIGLVYVALKLNGEAGELAEHVGKAMRDDGLIDHLETHEASGDNPGEHDCHTFGSYTLTDERRTALVKEAGDVLWYLGAVCRELGISLAECAAGNLDKLVDRDNRQVLQGSGDER